MKKVFTLFCALMVCVLFSGVANAQSPVTFQASPEPTSTGFAEGTHWYIMKLKDMFVTIENVDRDNNIKLTDNSTLTNIDITSDADQWCIVGDATSGYKFYNKKAGVDKVFGMSNLTSTNTKEYNYTEYGKSRAQMHDKGTTSSSAEDGIGTIFEIRTKDAPLTDYYIRLKDANITNRYLNSRGGYIGYWAAAQGDGGYGDPGSKIHFYEADSYWTDYWASIDYTAYENLATQMETLVGTTPFTSYPETAVNAFKNAIAEVKSFKPTDKISIYKALNVTNYLNDAKWTLRKSINGPKTDEITVYKVVNAYPDYNTYCVHAPLYWNNDKLILANKNVDRGIGWVFEPGSTSGSYKIKSADTGMYIKGTGSFSTTANRNEATDYFIVAYTDGGTSTVAIGVSDNIESHNWFHVNTNNSNILAWSGSAGASAWNIVEINDASFASLTDTRTTNMLLLPGVSENEAINTALTTYNNTVKFRTVESWNLLANTVNKVLNGKFYRINNKRTTRKLLATNGVDKPQMKTIADEKLVSCIWKFELDKNSGGYKLTNVNTPGKYVAVLLAAPGEANAFTTSENADVFTLSVEDDHFLIRNKDNHLMNSEELNTQTYPINYWDDNRYGGTKWQITELNSFTIDLHTAADAKSYASVYLPFSVSRVTGAKAYVAKTPETTTVTFSETVDGVMAQNGFLLISEKGAATATLNIGESNITSAMRGTLLDLTLNEADKAKYRVFGQKTGETVIGFFKPSAKLNTISANRAFFTNASGEALRLNFDGMVSGIETTELNNALNNNAPIYDLSGRRVMNAVKGGLYIQNGRKFIVK